MKTITTLDAFGNNRTYEVVEKIPSQFFIWNIGDISIGSDEYIPLCERLHPGVLRSSLDYYKINPDTVKVIKLNKAEATILREAAAYGINSKDEALKVLKGFARSEYTKKRKDYAMKAIAILKRITE